MRIDRFAPPGRSVRADLRWLLAIAALTVLIGCTSFYAAFARGLNEIYEVRYGIKVLREGFYMPRLAELLRGRFAGVWAFAAGCILLAVLYRGEFTRETKSIYVMKRLPHAWEYYRRWLPLPALCAVCFFAVCVALAALLSLAYFKNVPAQALPAGQNITIWEAFIL